MKRSILNNRKIAYLCGIIVLVSLWQAFSMFIGETVMVLPGPKQSLQYALYLLGKGYTYRCIGFTLEKMFTGFIISFGLALLFGIIAGNSVFFEEMFKPILIALRAVPTASLIYLFIILSGLKNAPILLVTMISFPIIYEGIKDGIRNIPESVTDAARVDGSTLFKENLYVRLPLSIPYIIVAVATSFSLSFKIEIMAEVITGSTNAGLGSAIAGARAADPTNMIPIFGYSLIAVVLMLMIDLLGSFLKRKFRYFNILNDE